MAKGIDAPINDIKTPWENYLGSRVEEFIKYMFDKKAGCFYYDQTNSRYMVFASEATRDEYLEDITKTELILGFFDAPSNYTAEITLLTPNYVPILLGATNNYIEFDFDVKNKSGQSIGEDVLCTYTFTQGSNKQVVSQKYRYGTHVRFNIDKYLSSGTNLITIGITGAGSLAATTTSVTYQVVDLSLSDDMDISNVYGTADMLEIPYTVSGFGSKIMEWYLDGVQQDFISSEDQITEVTTSRVKYIPLSNLAAGVHNIQFRVYTVINGEKFYSQTFYRDFMVRDYETDSVLIAAAATLPVGINPITDGGLKLYGLTQYTPYVLRIAIFNPTYAAVTPIEVYVKNSLATTLNMTNGAEAEYSLIITTYGETPILLKSENSEYSIGADVTKSSTTLEEITSGLTLDLRAIGKSNNSADYNKWAFGNIQTTFTGFLWNSHSGWSNNRLNMADGAKIIVGFNPLSSDVLNTGATLEFEFSTNNVSDNDAVICSLQNGDTGLLITASEASLTSATGAKVSTKYKSGENIRLSFVINRRAGVANKCLALLYVNGILSGAANYPTNDNFLVNGNALTISSSNETDIALKSLRFYNTALTSNQILNNYMLYRDTVEEMLEVYDRNDIYEEGSASFSVDALSGQLPIMIVTGNIPALEATTDKNLQIDVDIEYINLQDPSRSFTLKNGAMRPQGTSSMSYPKKNFRFYTKKKDNTILYDADGNVVENRLYAFKANAQPVDCWCNKADYAESSGTHNTGVARLWNDVLKNAIVGGTYKLRTKAQQAAIDNAYPYDVRTTVDGFPILMFYRLDENSPLVFIGKYNFNNDKSTESVFGFRDIPGFDNSKMQCWELLNNGHHLGLFNDTTNWASEWADAFEGRYPDGNTNTSDLKAFATWMSTVSQENFATEKWDHMDIYKMAAYYIYLMRCGAVDQVVKNSMFTSEDGVHWYFINYDNDTIFGVRNDGLLIYPPTIDRQTLDTSFSSSAGIKVYAYAGHDSRLWNMLEADKEFMDIVLEVDQALYTAGFSYDGVIDMFDNRQAGKWCERIYNQDAEYKYIGPFTDRGVNNLFMLQGSRSAYRRWWVSERFALLDAKYVSGEYKANSFEAKLAGAPIGLEFSITAGQDLSYGYGVNNVPIEYGIDLKRGESHTFTTKSVLNIGDPLRIYAAPYIEKIDISSFSIYLAQISIAPVYSERLGTKLKELILGSSDTNNSLNELSGINQATALEHLNIMNFKALSSVDLSNNVLLKSLNALGSGLSSVILPKNAAINRLWLPSTMQFLKLDNITGNLPIINTYPGNATGDPTPGLYIEGNACNLTDVEIINCPNVDSKTFVKNWLNAKIAPDSSCKLIAEGIDWDNFDVTTLIRIKRNFREASLKGVVHVPEVTEEEVTALYELFGNNCFSPQAELYIHAPAGVYLIGPSEVRPFNNYNYSYAAFGLEVSKAIWAVSGLAANSDISFNNGLLSISSNVSANFTINLTLISAGGDIIQKSLNVVCSRWAYPTINILEWPTEINKTGVYTFPIEFTGGDLDIYPLMSVEWAFIPSSEVEGFLVNVTSSDVNKAIVEISCATQEVIDINLTIRASVISPLNTTQSSVSKTIPILLNTVGTVIMTSSSNPKVMQACYEQGWAASPNFMTDVEAALVTDISSVFSKTTFQYCTFNEFRYFISVTNFTDIRALYYFSEVSLPFKHIPRTLTNLLYWSTDIIVNCPNLETVEDRTVYDNYVFSGIHIKVPKLKRISDYMTNNLRSIYAPLVEEIGLYGLQGLYGESIDSIVFPNLRIIGNYAFRSAKAKKVDLSNISSVGSYSFDYLSYLTEFKIIDLTEITNAMFISNCTALISISLPDLIKMTVPSQFSGTYTARFFYVLPALTELNLPSLTTIKGSMAFDTLTALTELNLPSLTTIDGNNVFYSLTALTELNLPSLTTLMSTYRTFSGCNSLAKLSMPLLTSWNQTSGTVGGTYKRIVEAFTACPELKELSLPALSTIYDVQTTASDYVGSFLHNSSITKISLPSLKILPGFFAGHANPNYTKTSLEIVEAPQLQEIGMYAFPYVPLKQIVGLNKVKKINKRGLAYVAEFTDIMDVSSAIELGEEALAQGTTGPESFILSSQLETIPYGCFIGSYMQSIDIPASVTTIGESAFSNCFHLHTIRCYNPVAPTIQNYTFSSIGTFAPEGTSFVLYVPSGATGYETWMDKLEQVGFSISYTL